MCVIRCNSQWTSKKSYTCWAWTKTRCDGLRHKFSCARVADQHCKRKSLFKNLTNVFQTLVHQQVFGTRLYVQNQKIGQIGDLVRSLFWIEPHSFSMKIKASNGNWSSTTNLDRKGFTDLKHLFCWEMNTNTFYTLTWVPKWFNF